MTRRAASSIINVGSKISFAERSETYDGRILAAAAILEDRRSQDACVDLKRALRLLDVETKLLMGTSEHHHQRYIVQLHVREHILIGRKQGPVDHHSQYLPMNSTGHVPINTYAQTVPDTLKTLFRPSCGKLDYLLGLVCRYLFAHDLAFWHKTQLERNQGSIANLSRSLVINLQKR